MKYRDVLHKVSAYNVNDLRHPDNLGANQVIGGVLGGGLGAGAGYLAGTALDMAGLLPYKPKVIKLLAALVGGIGGGALGVYAADKFTDKWAQPMPAASQVPADMRLGFADLWNQEKLDRVRDYIKNTAYDRGYEVELPASPLAWTPDSIQIQPRRGYRFRD